MDKILGPLTGMDILFAAAAAFLITHIVLRFQQIKKILTNDQGISVDCKGIDISAVMHKCKTLFPIETIIFQGKTFRQGMRVRITTSRKRVIEGQLVGKNETEVLCIITQKYIIAHEIDKIEEISILDQEARG